jgi:hypothetical protein
MRRRFMESCFLCGHNLKSQTVILVTHGTPEGDAAFVGGQNLNGQPLAARPEAAKSDDRLTPDSLTPAISADKKLPQVDFGRTLLV